MTMADQDYLKAYEQAVEDHGGEAFDVTLWANRQSQQLRFDAMIDAVDLRGRRILDAGCGRGDFAEHLLNRWVRYSRFIGVDGLASVIDFANRRRLKRAEFHAGDFVRDPSLLRIGKPDVITFSGTLNTMPLDMAKTLLREAWDATASVLIFNFLSDTAGPDAPPQAYPAHRLSTFSLLEFALSQTWQVRFYQDYFKHGHDAMIVMTRV